MSDSIDSIVGEIVTHLEQLKQQGVKRVQVSPAAWAELGQPLQILRPPAASPPSDANKATEMAKLRERALVCQKCSHLVRARTQVVFGVPTINSELMFVGEAPRADEDRQGEPFDGRAGQLLTKIIEAMGFTRDEVYIANILKCRPDMPAGSSGNRKPTPEEMNTCKPYLLTQVDVIKPR